MGNKPSTAAAAEDEPNEQEIEEALRKLQIEDPESWRVVQFQLTLKNGAKPFIYETFQEDLSSVSVTSRHLKRMKSIFSGTASAKVLPTRYKLLSGDVATNTIKGVGIGAIVVAAAVDTVRVGTTVYDDIKDNHTLSYKTVKTTSSVASSWAGAFAGAYAGSSTGAAIGGSIGALFGGVGAAPGAAIGSLIGGFAGGISAGIGASIAAEEIVDAVRGKLNGRLVTYDSGNMKLIPTFPPGTSSEVDEWHKVVFDFLKMVLINREMSIISWHKAVHIFSTVELEKITTKVAGDMICFKATLTASMLTDICKSPQFTYSELALTEAEPWIADARKLRGSSKSKVLKNEPKLDFEYVCMSNDGSSLCWLNPKLSLENVKWVLDKNGSDILVSDSPIFAII